MVKVTVCDICTKMLKDKEETHILRMFSPVTNMKKPVHELEICAKCFIRVEKHLNTHRQKNDYDKLELMANTKKKIKSEAKVKKSENKLESTKDEIITDSF